MSGVIWRRGLYIPWHFSLKYPPNVIWQPLDSLTLLSFFVRHYTSQCFNNSNENEYPAMSAFINNKLKTYVHVCHRAWHRHTITDKIVANYLYLLGTSEYSSRQVKQMAAVCAGTVFNISVFREREWDGGATAWPQINCGIGVAKPPLICCTSYLLQLRS